jgi:cation diffusion facilitator family transporter
MLPSSLPPLPYRHCAAMGKPAVFALEANGMHDHVHSPGAHPHLSDDGAHDHAFLGHGHARNERRTRLVIALTLVTMVVEIAAGWLFNSMALLADGFHMASHAGALAVAAGAYAYARRHVGNPAFTFGTGKVGDLAAFASAVSLALVALLIGWESLERLFEPVAIGFNEAIGVAVLGLVVNLASAALLHGGHDHGHDGPHHHDHNLRAAYLHVLADALTSVLAIAGLLAARFFGWLWMDPAVGLLGALVIARWSWGLIAQSAGVLLDKVGDPALPAAIRAAIERDGDRITDLHVWRVGPGHSAAVLSVLAAGDRSPADYKSRLAHLSALCHVTVEVNRAR